MDWIKTYWKTIVAIVGAVATVAWSAYSDHHISAAEGVQIVTALATAITVYLVPNIPSLPYVKTLAAAVLVATGLLTTYLAAGSNLTQAQWVNIGIAVLTALGVHLFNNTGDNLDVARAAAGPVYRGG